MSGDSSFHPNAFHNAEDNSAVICAGCHLPVPNFLIPRGSDRNTKNQAQRGKLSIKNSTVDAAYLFYNDCRHQLVEVVDLLSSPKGCPSCGSTEKDLALDVLIDPGPGYESEDLVSTSVCSSCAYSLQTRQSTPIPHGDEREYCIPQWLVVPPWKREYRTFTSEKLSPTPVAPSPVSSTPSGDSDTYLGADEAGSFEVRKAFYELIEGCRVTVGVIECTTECRPIQFIAIRGLVEVVERSGDSPRIILSVGDVDGWITESEFFAPDRVLLFGKRNGDSSKRGAEKYDTIEARVETWMNQGRPSPGFESLFTGYVTGLEYCSPDRHDYSVGKAVPVEGYPPEPDPPATVTELSTVFFEDGLLSVDLDASEKQWVAKLTGTSEQYHFSKDWIAYARPGRDSGIVSGSEELNPGAFIEIGWDSRQQFKPPKYNYSDIDENPYMIRRYFRVEDNQLVEWSREEVKDNLK